MPTTRRSTQRQQTPSEQDDSEPSTLSQQAAASGCRRGGGAKSAARGAKRLVSVAEEALHEKMTEEALIGQNRSKSILNNILFLGGCVASTTARHFFARHDTQVQYQR